MRGFQKGNTLGKQNKGKIIAWNKGKKGYINSGSFGQRPVWNKGKHNYQNTYEDIHRWLTDTFGKANQCEFCQTKLSTRYEYAKIRDKEYELKRENFIQLCKRCHLIYDDTWVKSWETRKAKKKLP